jgi:hypothetical protein|eukprot:COSAG02_NODE_7315_length_3067_cov_1.350404_2_plen_210_part_00
MPDVVNELPTSKPDNTASTAFHEDLFKGGGLAQLKDLVDKNGGQITVSRVSDTSSGKAGTALLPPNLETDLKDLQKNLEKTQAQIAELRKNCDSGLYDLEQSRRAMVTNPYKILTAGSGLAMLSKSSGLAAVPLTGFAALQGYDDFKNLREQTTFAGRGKYTLGLLADTAVGAGSLAFLTDSVPMKYKAPLLIGGLVARGAIDFIHPKK